VPTAGVGRSLFQATTIDVAHEIANLIRGQTTAKITPATSWDVQETAWAAPSPPASTGIAAGDPEGHLMTSFARTKRMLAVAILVGAAALSLPASAAAQFFINPSIGYNFGGDSGCPAITGCEAKNLNWGVSFGAIGSVVGTEVEFTDTSNFYGETAVTKTRVTTIMGHFLFAPKFGPVQLYGLGGLGLLKSQVDATGGAAVDEDQNDFGYDVGGGLMIFFGQHVGVRTDFRYFQSFDALKLIGLAELRQNDNKLNFNRFSAGVVFKF